VHPLGTCLQKKERKSEEKLQKKKNERRKREEESRDKWKRLADAGASFLTCLSSDMPLF